MFPTTHRLSICWISVITATSLIASQGFGDEAVVQFDVPALLSVRVLPVGDSHTASTSQKTIEVVIPVTTEIQAADRDNLHEFRFDVYWNRNVYPICNYGPKTQTTSSIDGLITVDQSKDKNASLGIDFSSGYQDMAKGSVKAELANRNGTKLHYQEIPQHELLVASGTIRRGTGAFFRFHPSRIESLEGGRDLVVAFEVPQHWRGGLLQVECHAIGRRKVLGTWSEPFEFDRAFVVPVYLDGDDQARQAATEFVRTEQELRFKWLTYGKQPQGDLLKQIQTALVSTGSRQSPNSKLPTDWVHYLIQSSDSYLEKYRRYLPSEVEVAAEQFVVARTDLLRLSR